MAQPPKNRLPHPADLPTWRHEHEHELRRRPGSSPLRYRHGRLAGVVSAPQEPTRHGRAYWPTRVPDFTSGLYEAQAMSTRSLIGRSVATGTQREPTCKAYVVRRSGQMVPPVRYSVTGAVVFGDVRGVLRARGVGRVVRVGPPTAAGPCASRTSRDSPGGGRTRSPRLHRD
jgi:hypothetical protein